MTESTVREPFGNRHDDQADLRAADVLWPCEPANRTHLDLAAENESESSYRPCDL